ncbi:hypothetical protein OG453_22630 [Streptomyces sp. NBC_01381]|uniref:hypothetical protein n=1 Tax=Streptomyces sp. NBC_01381 TaxID=2903845 RepID=UPI002256EAB5|nr:hypothetical protein [Streptomyces sp. NBC_01381]MCX4669440.1 hypothetical protein [Streptomyces sp. NBC_01381]
MPNEIIRHPRLSSDAVRLLTWQLSLPVDADESLSKTAQRAGIGKVAFLRAKGQLKDEGYVHEWREQVERGRWRTRQLVSNVPLSRDEAARVGAVSTQVAPTVAVPAAGAPMGRGVGRLPEQTPVGDTYQPSPEAVPVPEPALAAEARRIVDALHRLDPRLRVPRGILPELAELAAQWLAVGHTVDAVREEIRRQLPGCGTAVHHPGGLVRYVLREAPPLDVPAESSARVAQMVECAGAHTQPRLFRPVADELLCADCRQARAESAAGAQTAVRGAAVARAALRRWDGTPSAVPLPLVSGVRHGA